MSASTLRDRIARPVVALYWLAIVGGLALYTALDPTATTTPLWIGVIAGTCLGQVLALLNLRLWLVASSVLSLIYLGVPMALMGIHDTQFWMVLVPAVLCGFWSLGDRSALVAFWFPTVLWMLSILDRTRAHGAELVPDGVGAVLLGALALLFVMFLRAREARRVALWRTVGPTPIATATPAPSVLRERAGAPVSRLAWTLATGAIACGITAWIAPHLWKLEQLASDKRVESESIAQAKPRTWRAGTMTWNDESLPCCPTVERTERERVREYFDLGRGRDEDRRPRPITGLDCQICADSDPADYARVTGGWGRGGYRGYGYDRPSLPTLPTYNHGTETGGTGAYVAPTAPIAPSRDGLGGYSAPPIARPTVPSAPTTYTALPAPTVPTVMPQPQAPPRVASSIPTPRPTANTVRPTSTRPSIMTPPPPPPAPTHHRALWIALVFVGALMFQVVALALRPIRRAIALRHLRRPYWDETVDQRISNSWQLALVGLRDAGWRASSTEAPREFAQRTGITGVDRCATILERARHGIGIDRGDLDDMARSADDAYHSAREQIGGVARTTAWLRWPLT